jgi:hypothetical protein
MDEYGGYQKNRILTAKKIGEKINHFNLDQYSNPSCKSGNYNTGYEIVPFCLYGIWQPPNIIEPNGSTPTTIGFFMQCCFKYLDTPDK